MRGQRVVRPFQLVQRGTLSRQSTVSFPSARDFHQSQCCCLEGPQPDTRKARQINADASFAILKIGAKNANAASASRPAPPPRHPTSRQTQSPRGGGGIGQSGRERRPQRGSGSRGARRMGHSREEDEEGGDEEAQLQQRRTTDADDELSEEQISREFVKYVEELSDKRKEMETKRLGYEVPEVSYDAFLAHAPAIPSTEYGTKAMLDQEIKRVTGRRPFEFRGVDNMSRDVVSRKWVNFESKEEKKETLDWTAMDRERMWERIDERRMIKGQKPIKKEFKVEVEGISQEDRKAVMAKMIAGEYPGVAASGLMKEVQRKLRSNSSYTAPDTQQILEKISSLLPKQAAS